MKRDPRLHGLSAEHHHALVLARATGRGELDGKTLARRFAEEVEPHFAVEERLLLPAMARAGGGELVARTEAEHAALRALVCRAAGGDASALPAFAAALAAHVRFEERSLFPWCEERLEGRVLDEIEHAAPRM